MEALDTIDCLLGIDSVVRNHLQFPLLEKQEQYAIHLVSTNRTLQSNPTNLVDAVWKNRPPIPPDNLTRLPDRVIRTFINFMYTLSAL